MQCILLELRVVRLNLLRFQRSCEIDTIISIIELFRHLVWQYPILRDAAL